MGVVYRPIHKGDLVQALKLWTEVFGVEEWFFASSIEAEPARKLSQTLGAFEDDEKLVSCVQFFVRPTRSANGTPERMGAIANVATLPDYRGRGLSSALLRMSILAMRREACQWSMLFTGVNSHYEKEGWRTVETRYREGTLRPGSVEGSEADHLKVQIPKEEPKCWKVLQDLYRQYNRTRTLTHCRHTAYWGMVIEPRLTRWDQVLVTFWGKDNREPLSYLIATFEDEKALIHEVGYAPNGKETVLQLFDRFRIECQRRNVNAIRARLPYEPVVNHALGEILESVHDVQDGSVMVRSLVPEVNQEELEGRFQLPGAHFWHLDGF